MKTYSKKECIDIENIISQSIPLLKDILWDDYLVDFLWTSVPEIRVCKKWGFDSITARPTTKNVDTFVKQVLAKMNKKNIYKNFTSVFKKIWIPCLYYTSYWFWFSTLYLKKSIVTDAENKLNELWIQYKTEFSDANRIYRFRISQSKENLEKIKNLV